MQIVPWYCTACGAQFDTSGGGVCARCQRIVCLRCLGVWRITRGVSLGQQVCRVCKAATPPLADSEIGDQESALKLRYDLLSARALIWLARRATQSDELTTDARIYMFDRYSRLAQHQRHHGRAAAAERLESQARQYAPHGGEDGPPFAAAMGMSRPRQWVLTDALGRDASGPGGNAA